LDVRRALQPRPRLEAQPKDDGPGVAAVEGTAVPTDDLKIANERSQPERARLAHGKGETHRRSEAESIESAGAHVKRVAVDPGSGAAERFPFVRPLEAHLLRLARELDAQARARGPGG